MSDPKIIRCGNACCPNIHYAAISIQFCEALFELISGFFSFTQDKGYKETY